MKLKALFLKAAVILIGILVTALLIFVLPLIAEDAAASSLKMAYVLYAILTIMYISSAPFFALLFQIFKVLNYVQAEEFFSKPTLNALNKIKRYGYTISFLYLLALPLFYIVGEVDDAPGVILIGMFFLFASLVLSVSTDLFQNLLKGEYDKIEDSIIERIVKARNENFNPKDALTEKDVNNLLNKD